MKDVKLIPLDPSQGITWSSTRARLKRSLASKHKAIRAKANFQSLKSPPHPCSVSRGASQGTIRCREIGGSSRSKCFDTDRAGVPLPSRICSRPHCDLWAQGRGIGSLLFLDGEVRQVKNLTDLNHVAFFGGAPQRPFQKLFF